MPPIVQSAGRLIVAERASDVLASSGLPFGSLNLYNGNVQTYARIIRTQPNARTVVSFIARNIAQLGIHLFDRIDDNDRERVTDHPFVSAIRRPNPADRRMTRYRLIHGTLWDLCAYDVSLWGLIDAAGAERPAIIRLPPPKLTIEGGLWPEAFIYEGKRGRYRFRPDQVVYFQGSLGMDDEKWGNPPIESLRRILAEEAAQGEYREQFWTRGARHSGWIERPAEAPDWSTGARDRFRREWREAYAGRGDDAGGTPLLEDGMTFRPASDTDARSSQYVESRKLTREECAAAFHVDPIWVGVSGTGESFASVKERHRALYMDDLGPWVAMLEQDLEAQALPAFEPDPVRLETLYVRINIAEKLRGSVEEQAEALNRLVGRPILTANEGRALIERNALDEGEGLVLPLNVVIGGQTVPGLAPAGSGQAGDGPDGRKRIGPGGTKAVGLTPAMLDALRAEHGAAHAQVVSRTFERQAAEVLSELGASGSLVFDRDRWDGELTADLFAAGVSLAEAVALLQADTFGLEADDVDTEVLQPFLAVNARIAAEGINATTFEHLGEALSGQAGEDALDAARHVFEVGASARAGQIAQSRFTTVAGFTGRDVARQAGRNVKVWNVTSSNSRHPELDGEAVPLGQLFSNGADYPGDPVLGASESAGCTCYLTFE